MLFHTLAEPGSGMYVEQYSATITGPLHVSLFQQAWNQALARHPALRTAFLWQDLDEPLQVVRQQVDLEWTCLDWQDESPDAIQQHWDTLLAEDRSRGFALVQAPLMRMTLVQTGEGAYRFCWTFHHLLLDGWSAVTVLHEVWTDYAALCDGETADLKPPRPFRDYVAWHRSHDLAAEEAYWTDRLRGFQSPTPLHIDQSPRTDAPTGRAECQLILSADETTTARAFAKQHRLTLNTLVQGAWALLLSRYSGEDDVVYGTTIAGRPSTLNGVESMVGAFINTVPMRVQTDPDVNPTEWLQEVQTTLLDVRPHALAPLNKIQQWSPIPGGQNLFDSLLVFENHPSVRDHPAEAAGLRVEEAAFRGQSNYPLALLAIPDDRLRFTAVYDTARFRDDRIERLLRHLSVLLTGLVEGRVEQLVTCPMLTARERRALLQPPQSPSLSVGNEALGIHHLIEETAQQTPAADAVQFADEALTYAELEAHANALAQSLTAHGVESGDFVGLFMKRSPVMVVGLLAILKAGGAYVPLDPTYPMDRLQYMINDCKASVVVTTAALAAEVPGGDAAVVCIEDVLDATFSDDASVGKAAADKASGDEIASSSTPVAPEQPAYVIYTSGSTGTPKGVVVTHANLIFSTRARQSYYTEPPKAFLLLSPFGFDSSVAGLFWTLTTGGTLVLPRSGKEKNVVQIAALIYRHTVSHTLCIPALYALLLEHASPQQLTTLRTVIVAGEACPSTLPARHHDTLPHAALYNEYGPTEATVWTTVHRVEPESLHASVPIGRAIPGVQTYVLDKHQRLMPPGVPGELYIGGPGVTPGYLNRPEETAKRFIPSPLTLDNSTTGNSPRGNFPKTEYLYRTGDRVRADENGVLEFLGRIDNQVKLRGHRIEIGEVEAALRRHEAVENGAVAVRTVGGTRQLVAYVVLVSSARSLDHMDEGPSLTALRNTLRQQLPEYMVPSHIEFVEALPRTPNGKVDRAALPTPAARQAVDEAERVTPNDPVEMRMLGLWEDLLDMRPLSMTDNFFHLGGDSLLAVTLSTRIEKAFDMPVAISALFDHPTPKTLTEWIRSDVKAVSSPVPVRSAGTRPPLFCIPGSGGYPVLFYKLGSYLGADQPVYSFQPEGVDGRALPRTTIESMAEQHLGEMKTMQPTGPYHLCGFSVGGLVAYEMAQQLHRDGEEIAFLGLLDTRLHKAPWPARWIQRLKDDLKYWLRRQEALSHLRAGRVMPRALRNSFPAKVHERAARRYVPRPYPGSADLFAAVDASNDAAPNVDIWAALIGSDFTVHEIPAGHDIVKEPYVGDLADRLAERLNDCLRKHPDPTSSVVQSDTHAR